jgi:hypothetical protein
VPEIQDQKRGEEIELTSFGESVFLNAARAHAEEGTAKTDWRRLSQHPPFRAAVESAYRAGREDEARSQAAAALDFERGFQVGRRAGQEDAIRRAIDLLRLERDKAADAGDRDYVYALIGARKLVEGVLRIEPDLPGSDGVQPTGLPIEAVRALCVLWDTWWNKVDTYDPGEVAGIASLLGSEGSAAMEEACDAVEPYESAIAAFLARDQAGVQPTGEQRTEDQKRDEEQGHG